MDANKLREEIIARAKNRGADIVAFGGIDRFDDENILKIYPETKTVICLALRVLRGSYRGVEEGTTYYQYVTTGVEVLEETLLPMILLDVSAAIEDAGFTAIPQRRNQMLLPDEASVNEEMLHYEGYRGEGEPQMDFAKDAVTCGVGERGLSGAVLTDDFGPFVRYAFVLTDAVLEETPAFVPHLCDNCGECVKACPGHALSENGEKSGWQCAAYYRGANIHKNPYMDDTAYENLPNRDDIMEGKADLSQEEAKEVMALTYFYPPVKHGYTASICGRACDRACYIHLEKEGKLKKKFKLPFRLRDDWSLPKL
ncbi:MAG: 4Fe-4S binding protein [Clostridia bacterium]|nr:4Fe-4S binding protein [Clostridia bacterium]